MPVFKNLSGMKFGRLSVIERAETRKKRTLWNCVCECGKKRTVESDSLLRGNSKSCGCIRQPPNNITHGHSSRVRNRDIGKRISPEYRSWTGMKTRCYNEKSEKYPIYGGRGIKICDEWLNNFQLFLDDMGLRPSPKHSIDRIEVDGDYEPSNCRWATKSIQGYNQRISTRNTSGVRGVSWDTAQNKWSANIRLNRKGIHLGRYSNFDDAVKARIEGEEKYFRESTM